MGICSARDNYTTDGEMTMLQDQGRLLLSIDVPTSRQSQQAHASLLAACDQHQLPATWALTDSNSSFCERLGASRTSHEVALLATSDWADAGVGRTRFAQQLTARLEKVRRHGTEVSTLALADCDLGEHVDLLVKHRLSVVRTCETNASVGAAAVNARSLRFGVWQARPNLEIPHTTRWWQSPTHQLSRLVQAAAERRAVVHLRIHADVVAQDVRWRKAVEFVLEQAARMVEKERLVVCPLRSIASAFGKTRTRARSHASILRRAA